MSNKVLLKHKISSFFHLTNLSTYSVPGSVLGSTYMMVNTIDKDSALKDVYSSAEGILREMTGKKEGG